MGRAAGPEAYRRLACDGALTRVLVTPSPPTRPSSANGSDPAELQGQLRAATALLPPTLGGAPCQPLDLWRSTRVVSPAQGHPLAVRDHGGVFPNGDRPWPGVTPSIGGTGSMAAQPTWTTSCSSAEPIIGPSMTAAGS